MKTYFSSLKNVIKRKPIIMKKSKSPLQGRKSPQRTGLNAHMAQKEEFGYSTQRGINNRYENDTQSIVSRVNVKEIVP